MVDYPSDKNWKDHGNTSIKTALNLVPFAGGALATLYETVFSSPIDKRKEEWLIQLAKTVDEICDQVSGLTLENLSENELFISAYLQASNIAVRTHQKEKINALQKAVKNTVVITDIDETLKLIFIRIIDDLTPMHFQVLHFLASPEFYIQKLKAKSSPGSMVHWGDMRNVWNETFKEVKAQSTIIDLVISDLYRFGLVRVEKFHEARLDSVSTDIGNNFIKFIELES
jgi:hypothetical protein